MDDYVSAISKITDISPRACREKAMKDYHYMRMSADYIAEYEREILQDGTKEDAI
jgi:hypothetical protein